MRMKKGFTLIELLVVISIIALLIGILLPALGAARRTARQMQNNTQVRGIQSALVLYASGNGTYYTGLTSRGAVASASDHQDNGGPAGAAALDTGHGSEYPGTQVDQRFEELLAEAYFTGEYIISPAEVKTAWTNGELFDGSVSNETHYSYSMLRIGTSLTPTSGAVMKEQAAEWKDTINTEAIVVSDRAKGRSAATLQSIWTTDDQDWRGSVAWNDNHVTFEATSTIARTKYGTDTNTNDELFSNTNNAGDAIMVYRQDGTNAYDFFSDLNP